MMNVISIRGFVVGIDCIVMTNFIQKKYQQRSVIGVDMTCDVYQEQNPLCDFDCFIASLMSISPVVCR